MCRGEGRPCTGLITRDRGDQIDVLRRIHDTGPARRSRHRRGRSRSRASCARRSRASRPAPNGVAAGRAPDERRAGGPRSPWPPIERRSSAAGSVLQVQTLRELREERHRAQAHEEEQAVLRSRRGDRQEREQRAGAPEARNVVAATGAAAARGREQRQGSSSATSRKSQREDASAAKHRSEIGGDRRPLADRRKSARSARARANANGSPSGSR